MSHDSGGGHRSRSIMAGSLHYANLVALVGIASVFLTTFISWGWAQLFRMPNDPSEYSEFHGQSLWDYVWQNIGSNDVDVSKQGGLLTSFTLALIMILICSGISRKMQKDGPTPMLAAVTIGLCGVGAGLLHSFASLLFVIPVVMALPLLAAPLFRGMGGPQAAGATGPGGVPGVACPACGAENPDKAAFCGRCGAKIE